MESQKTISKFLPLWLGVNALGWAFYSATRILSFWNFGITISIGFCLGFFQWLVLKKFFRVESSWMWVSAIAYGVLLTLLILLPLENLKSSVLLFFLSLMILGFLQRSVLEYYLNGAFLWVLSSPIAGVTALISMLGIQSLTGNSSFLAWALFGLVYGVITGGVLSFMYTITPSGQV